MFITVATFLYAFSIILKSSSEMALLRLITASFDAAKKGGLLPVGYPPTAGGVTFRITLEYTVRAARAGTRCPQSVSMRCTFSSAIAD